MENLTGLLNRLREKYGEPLTLGELLYPKYGGETGKRVPEPGGGECEPAKSKDVAGNETPNKGKPESEEAPSAIFTFDWKHNREALERMVSSFGKVERYAEDSVLIEKQSPSEKKLLLKYKNELIGLIDKEEYYQSPKLAKKYAKLVEKTLLKLWTYRKYADVLYDYLKENHIKMESYEPGHKLTDDEICMLDGGVIEAYKVITKDQAKKYEVIKMVQPIIRISYIEDEGDGEVEYIDICGICSFYGF